MSERILEIETGTQEHIKVICNDQPGPGGGCHKYVVVEADQKEAGDDYFTGVFATVYFQNGPVKENGVNGCHNEDLLAIVIDRLQHFQVGDYACQENAVALSYLIDALAALRTRTDQRKERGVEGTSGK